MTNDSKTGLKVREFWIVCRAWTDRTVMDNPGPPNIFDKNYDKIIHVIEADPVLAEIERLKKERDEFQKWWSDLSAKNLEQRNKAAETIEKLQQELAACREALAKEKSKA